MKSFFKILSLAACLGLSSLANAQCNDVLDGYSQNATCNSTDGYAYAYLWNSSNATFLWSNGATTDYNPNLAPGSYTVTATDVASGCTYTNTFVVGNDPLSIYNCSYICDPQQSGNYLEACIWSGLAPYTYEWSIAGTVVSTAATLQGPTPSTTYSLVVTDATGCTGTMTVDVPALFTVPTVTSTIVDATCGGNGSIDLNITGSATVFSFDWYYFDPMFGQTYIGSSEDMTGLVPGDYVVYMYDNSQCNSLSFNFTVGGLGTPQITYQVVGEACMASNGLIGLHMTGFATTPSITWSNGATSTINAGLAQGMYSVTVSDGNCSIVENIQVYDNGCNTYLTGTVYDASLPNTCDPFSSIPLSYQLVTLQPSGLTMSTDMWGGYRFPIATMGDYTVELYNPDVAANLLCPATNSIAVTIATQGWHSGSDFFVVSPNSNDVKIDLYNYTAAVAGSPFFTTITYCNHGNQVATGDFTYTYDPILMYNTSNVWSGNATFISDNSNVLTFSYTNLNPGQCGSVGIDFDTDAAAVLGSNVHNCANITPSAGDDNPADNDDCNDLVVLASLDPNSKHVSPFHSGDEAAGGIILETEEQLEYTINFQNMGTSYAVNVVVRDTLDANLIPTSIEGITTSHNCNIRVDGNILTFDFANIYLPSVDADPANSDGFIHFFINRRAGLPIGTQISNTATIYFDANIPVVTNTVVSTINILSSTHLVTTNEMKVTVMPNPFRQVLTVQYELTTTTDVSIELYNALGERVEMLVPATNQMPGTYQQQFSTDSLASGVYLLQISTADGISSHRIIKE